jgi:hypothetical protein
MAYTRKLRDEEWRPSGVPAKVRRKLLPPASMIGNVRLGYRLETYDRVLQVDAVAFSLKCFQNGCLFKEGAAIALRAKPFFADNRLIGTCERIEAKTKKELERGSFNH